MARPCRTLHTKEHEVEGAQTGESTAPLVGASAPLRVLDAHRCTPTPEKLGSIGVMIALWMGHENMATVQVYIHADLALKERALARTAPQDAPPSRYQPPDTVLAFLDGL